MEEKIKEYDFEKRKRELEKKYLFIFSNLIKASFHDEVKLDNNEYEAKRRINMLACIAYEQTMQMDRKLNPEYEVYWNDIVTLSIDGGESSEYYLTSMNMDNEENKTIESTFETTQSFDDDEIIKIGSNIGYAILGKRIGDTFTYTDDDSKNEHTGVILEVRKTKYSYRVTYLTKEEEDELINNGRSR